VSDAPDLARGEALFRIEPRFEMGAVSLAALPAAGPPEIAFAGRSNVGKSSLINALCNRRQLARASGEPGRTRELNYFMFADREGRALLRLVDLPGYGYAKAPKTEIAKWSGLTRDFLRGRAPLKRVFLLIDSRHGLKDTDLGVMAMLDEAAVVYQIVLTKADKLKSSEETAVLAKTAAAVAKRPAAFPRALAVSAHSGAGLEALKAEIATIAAWPDAAPAG
jgi:GTP-binding protein